MKRILSLLAVLTLLATLAVPAWGAEDTFVPSIGYKDGPDVEKAEIEDEDVTPCLVVTSILEAKNKETDIFQEERDLLLEVYEKLRLDEMKLPLGDEDYVIRELVDISFMKSVCVEPGDEHKEWLAQEETDITVTLRTGIPAHVDVKVLVYLNGEWVVVDGVTNNNDQTITVVFPNICPVAILVPTGTPDTPPATGDILGGMLWLWLLVLILSMAALGVLLKTRRRFLR